VEYQIDQRELKFQLFEWLETEKLLEAEQFADWDLDNVEMIVDEALKIAKEKMAPANDAGDREGAHWENGVVSMPEAYRPAYETLAEGGWFGLINNPEFGGMGVPEVIGTAVTELFSGSNVSLTLTVMLTRGAGAMIELFGTDELRQTFVEKMYSGQWGGTMCLTEAQAGSDVGASTTRAVEQDDGSYLITGEKIFITSGDQDLTENIIHLVLARLPDAPAGTKGLSLFVIPKKRVAPDGSLGEDNDVACANIEEKLGIHGSPTCSLVFGQNNACQGFLLGEKNQGMKLMFHLMNAARIEVGLQGGAIASAAYQAALSYAKQRLQSRHYKEFKNPDAPQVPIIEHPDVRRMLLSSKAYVEAIRALLLKTSYYLDMSHISQGEEQERYHSYVEVLTPICKAWGSRWGFTITDWCLEVFGGYGYTKEYPAEQYLRDSKIACIYEGTNGIQALDFVARKLMLNGGVPVKELLGQAEAVFKKLKDDPEMSEPAWLLAAALKQMESISKELMKRPDGIQLLLLNAIPLLDMTGTILGAQFLLEHALIAKAKLAEILAAEGVTTEDKRAYKSFLQDHEEAAFYHTKIQTAIHFAYRALPMVPAQAAAIRSGEKSPLYAVL